MEKKRIYKYDNVKAFLIFLVVIGHMTSDYVSDSHLVRWITLWIYTFHMPAFIFISGLMHKQYITRERAELGFKGEMRMRWDKVAGFFLCAYGLKIFIHYSRLLMGQNPQWSWTEEPGIPWYLFVMAEYELVFYIMKYIDGGSSTKPSGKRPLFVIAGAFALSAVIGYFPSVGDNFCLSRMINFLPIYMLGYYLDMKKLLPFLHGEGYGGGREEGADRRRRLMKAFGWLTIIVTMAVCCLGKFGMYSWRKWFTGRRSYEFLQEFFSYAYDNGWWIRLAVWAVALVITFAVISLIPDRDLGFITTVGSRTLSVYFWHRPLCYLFRSWEVLPKLYVLFGGKYNDAVAGTVRGFAFTGTDAKMILPLLVYCLIGAAMTALFSLKLFTHPTADLMKLGTRISMIGRKDN